MSYPETYSYDAPSSYINFGSPVEEDDHNADSWFDIAGVRTEPVIDQVMDAENIPPDQHKDNMLNTPASKLNGTNSCSVTPMASADEQHNDPNIQKSQGPFNIATSMETWRKTGKKQSTPGASAGNPQRRSSRRLSVKERSKHLAKIRAERRTATSTQPDERPPTKKQKLAGKLLLERRINSAPRHVQRTRSRSNLSDAANNSGPSVSLADSLCSSKQKSRLAIPSTPTVLKRKNFPVKVKSSEEQELEKMQQLQQEVVEQRRKNEESLKAAIAGAGQPVKKMVSQVTKPMDFHFRTDDRLKRHTDESAVEQYKEVDFTSVLRKHPASPARVPKGGHTVPKPFNLSQGNKRKLEESDSGGGFISTAEQVLAFYKRTPSRYHLRSRQKEMEGPSPLKPMKQKLTNPKTPLLQTKQRHRPVTCKSAEELEAEELEKLQQFQFKARELDPRILEGGLILPKKPPVREPTKAIGFDLEIEKRIQQREKKEDEEVEPYSFHSRPCPSKILADVVGVPDKKVLPVTIPKSPAFALKNRVRVQEEEEEEEEIPVIKANPMPHYGVPFKPKLEEQRPVEVCPFSFCDRDRDRMLQKEKKLDKLRKEEPPTFKAQPLPQFDHISLPEKKVKIPTQQEPFQLEIDRRGVTKIQRWKQQIKEELKQQKEQSIFKARPNTVTHHLPFVPKKESKSLTESLSGSVVQEGFELATERRARERQEFEKRLAEVEAHKCLLEEEERQRQEEAEREELNRLRHELVHKAQPIRKYRAVEVKASDVPLTVPKAPNFSDRFKC